MKKILWIVLVFSIFTLTACVKITDDNPPVIDDIKPVDVSNIQKEEVSKTPKGYSFYENTNHNFSTYYPETRSKQENKTNLIVEFSESKTIDSVYWASFGVTVYDIAEDMDLTTYTQEILTLIQMLVSDLKLDSKRETKLAGIEAITLNYVGSKWIRDIQREQVIFIKDNKAYILTYSTSPDTFKNNTKQRKDFLSYFEFTSP